MKMLRTLIFCSVLNFMTIGLDFSRSVGQFCDNSFVDAVLWDGISYKITRNEWIATYDHKSGTVGPFAHKSDSIFQNEKGYYYQSVYNIPTVPECNQTTISCQMIDSLKGLTVYAIRRYSSSEKDSFDVIHRVYRNGNGQSLKKDINIQTFIESNLLPKNSQQKYRPSVFSPKDFTFIHITNKYQNFGPLLETIQLKTNGVIERSYHELNQFKDIVFITSFWWTFTQKVYIIGEHRSGFGNPFIYELELKNNNIVLKPINKSVMEFFGCIKPKANGLEKLIKNKIANHDLEQWSVRTFPTTHLPKNNIPNEMSDRRPERKTYPKTDSIRPSVRPLTTPPTRLSMRLPTDPTLERISEQQSRQTTPPYQRTEQLRDKWSDSSPHPITDRRVEQRFDYRDSQISDRIMNRTAHNVEPSHEYIPKQRSRYGVTNQMNNSKNGLQKLGQNSEQIINEKFVQNSQQKVFDNNQEQTDSKHFKFAPLKLSRFWKIFPVIVMTTLLIMAVCSLLLGFVAVLNLKRLLSKDLKKGKQKSFNRIKKERVKGEDDFSDFFIEEYSTPPKHLFSADNDCQTNESFESIDRDPARTVL